MKKYIYPVLLLTAMVMSFTSCIDEFDADDKATYPNYLSLGTWANDFTASDGPNSSLHTYEVNFTENVNGDTIVNISMLYIYYNQEGTLDTIPVNTLNGHITEYDPVAGMITVDFPSSELGNFLVGTPLPARAYMTFDRHATALRVDMQLNYNGNMYDANYYLGIGVFSVAKYAHPINVLGYWEDAETGTMLGLTREGYAEISEGWEAILATYTYDKMNGTMVFYAAEETVEGEPAEGETTEREVIATAYFNERSQLKFTRHAEGATEILLDRAVY